MNLITPVIRHSIQNEIYPSMAHGRHGETKQLIAQTLEMMYNAIPPGKRISFGRVHTVKILAQEIHTVFEEEKADGFNLVTVLLRQAQNDRVQGVALGILSLYGLNHFEAVLPFFETGAASDDWDLREFSQMFFRKLIREHPDRAHEFLLEKVNSHDPNIRRFVSETLRPVVENQ